jgi:GAF domain-containing protein
MARRSTGKHDRSYWRTLYAAVVEIASSLNLEDVLNRLVRHVAEAMEVKAATLRLLMADGDTLAARTSYGLSERYLHKGPVDLAHSPLDRDTLAGQPVWVPDVRSDPRFQYPQQAAQEGLVSALCVPLEAQGRRIGVLRVYSGERREFDAEETEFLTALADLGAIAIENARLHEQLRQDYDQTVGALLGTPAEPSPATLTTPDRNER